MTTTALKLLALVLMLIDHIGVFIPGTPIWFRWLGRISAPLFMFCTVWGFSFTAHKKRYLTRMYLLGLAMAIINLTINILYKDTYVYIENNFFTTLFLISVIIFLINKKDKKLNIGFCVWQLVSFILCLILVEFIKFPSLPNMLPTYMFYGSLFGNVIFTEGGFFFIVLGILLYLAKDSKKKLIIYYSGFSILCYILVRKYGNYRGPIKYFVPFAEYQWMMITALPFLLLYNSKKGVGLKSLFYIFYPFHVIVLYLIGINLK